MDKHKAWATTSIAQVRLVRLASTDTRHLVFVCHVSESAAVLLAGSGSYQLALGVATLTILSITDLV